jgi:hypothetical protein
VYEPIGQPDYVIRRPAPSRDPHHVYAIIDDAAGRTIARCEQLNRITGNAFRLASTEHEELIRFAGVHLGLRADTRLTMPGDADAGFLRRSQPLRTITGRRLQYIDATGRTAATLDESINLLTAAWSWLKASSPIPIATGPRQFLLSDPRDPASPFADYVLRPGAIKARAVEITLRRTDETVDELIVIVTGCLLMSIGG